MTILKECPICPEGGKPWFNPHTNESSDNGSRIAIIGCAICGLTMKCANFPQMDGTWKLTKDLVEIWNTRPTPAPQVDADEYTIANLVMFIQRLARKLGATDKAAAQALEFIERKKLGGSVLRQDTLPQPPQEE